MAHGECLRERDLTAVSKGVIKLAGQGKIKGDTQKNSGKLVRITGNGLIEGSAFVIGNPSLNFGSNAVPDRFR